MQATTTERLDALESKLDRISAQLDQIVEAQRPFVELTREMGPIASEVMSTGIDHLEFLEQRGYFAFARELKYLVDRIVEDYDPADLHELADNAANILDTVRTVTQPSVMAVVRDAADSFSARRKLEPVGVLGALRKVRKDKNVQRGLAFALDVLGRVGRAVSRAPRLSRRELRALPESGVEPVRRADPSPRDSVPMLPPAPPITDEMTFIADADWNRDVAAAIARQVGIAELSDAHWTLVELVRGEYSRSGATPNIRKITGLSGVPTREVYALFPKAPGKTLAKIAGVPKPVGCL